ncbi:MAG: hypothetical protein JHC95_07685 [Solirubrobacteraceae bacterium]|nr:hypothetical protein [Solirubrobacteraceae bacterium]
MPSHPSDLIYLTVVGRPDDPRAAEPPPPGVVIRHVPELHPEEMTVVDGLPVTSVARTLVDVAEDSTREELAAMFRRAREKGLLDMAAVERSYARVEWRPSLPMLRSVMDEILAEG